MNSTNGISQMKNIEFNCFRENFSVYSKDCTIFLLTVFDWSLKPLSKRFIGQGNRQVFNNNQLFKSILKKLRKSPTMTLDVI